MKANYLQAVESSQILNVLADYDPRIAGTPPLGLDTPDSDIDVICQCDDTVRYANQIWTAFADRPDFRQRQWISDGRPIITNLEAAGWRIEIFAANLPVSEQRAWRHFEVERRLLDIGGENFRAALMVLRRRGAKTEPAFAESLALQGDPYEALLILADFSDSRLRDIVRQAGF